MSALATPAAAVKPLVVALIGNPNTGKSTLFNALTGGNARVGNFPGVTVEKKTGRLKHAGQEVTLVDLPGTYSLAPRSADEMVSVDVLLGRQAEIGRPDAVVCITDSTNLERNLYLFSQIRDLGLPVVLVLNMWDTAQSRGIQINQELLATRLGIPVVVTSAQRREGMEQLKGAILQVVQQAPPAPLRLFPETFSSEMVMLQTWLSAAGSPPLPGYLLERLLLDVHGESEHRASLGVTGNLSEYLGAARQRLLHAGCRVPMVETKVRYDWIRRQLDGVVQASQSARQQTASDRIDRIVTHRVLGLVIFCALMLLVFQTISTWADPVMGLVETGQEWVQGLVTSVMAPGTFRSLLVDGVIAGVGSVVIFLPQIVLLFLFIALLEDCGYMARAAFLMDKLMTKVGLSGKSFLPLMSSYACAIPGIMATRTIENRRDRMVTMLIAPLMSCTARLPVYLLLIGAFVPPLTLVKWGKTFTSGSGDAAREYFLGLWITLPAVTLFAFYALGAVVAIPIAWLLKKTLFKGETPPFVMELPSYKWPSPRIVFDRVLDRAKAFLGEAGTLIFFVSVLIWAAGYFPGDHSQEHQLQSQIESISALGESRAAEAELLKDQQKAVSAQLIRDSYLGWTGQAIEPVVRPLGWDWRIGVGAVASFPAREVIVATLGTIFSLGGDVEAEDPGLRETLANATWPDGRPLFTIPVALSVMVFFALCAQCGATLMVIRRETNSWRWPLFTFTYMTVLAYIGALVTYQAGTWLLG